MGSPMDTRLVDCYSKFKGLAATESYDGVLVVPLLLFGFKTNAMMKTIQPKMNTTIPRPRLSGVIAAPATISNVPNKTTGQNVDNFVTLPFFGKERELCWYFTFLSQGVL